MLRWVLITYSVLGLWLLPDISYASGGEGDTLLQDIGFSILAATVLAYLAHMVKQPMLLAYILAGVVIGPIGFGWVQDQKNIEIIAEMGLILLLFMIGLELDLKKLRESGKSLILTGALQFILCVAMGLGFFYLLGFTFGTGQSYDVLGVPIQGGEYDLLYLGVCIGISSTTIVVKLLYEKFELDTLAGRITLGVLVFQDIWAIVVLGIQPNLANPEVLDILWSFVKGGLLVIFSLFISKYVLGLIFKQIAKLPELVLVASLGWCVFVCGLAGYLGLSLEMGALIAGAAISTFPYNLDVIAKIVSIRDFFITLFFVGLGMQIPAVSENMGLVGLALVVSAFLIVTRFLSVFPILYFLKNGHRTSLLPAINLSQISEFSLVIASLGVNAHHINDDILTIITFTFVITSVVSTYMIKYNHILQGTLSRFLNFLGFKDIENSPRDETGIPGKEIALLGFFRAASSLIKEIEDLDAEHAKEFKQKLVVVDFNPVVHQKLQSHGIKVVYGDIGHLETLNHAGISEAKIVISSIPDTMLKGTDNLRIIKKIQRLCPHARIIVTAESPSRALKMYSEGADFVVLPRVLSAKQLLDVLTLVTHEEKKDWLPELRNNEIAHLTTHEEIIS